MRLFQLGVVEPGQQVVHPGQGRTRRVVQQLEDGDVQRAGGSFERIDRNVALAAFDVGQEALATGASRPASCLRVMPRRARQARTRAPSSTKMALESCSADGSTWFF